MHVGHKLCYVMVLLTEKGKYNPRLLWINVVTKKQISKSKSCGRLNLYIKQILICIQISYILYIALSHFI